MMMSKHFILTVVRFSNTKAHTCEGSLRFSLEASLFFCIGLRVVQWTPAASRVRNGCWRVRHYGCGHSLRVTPVPAPAP